MSTLRKLDTIVSEDFPEYEVDIRRPGTDDWSDFQTACGNSNALEGMLNLLIACGKVRTLDGSAAPKIGELVDEWSTLPEIATGTAGMLGGAFANGVNATRLDLPAILAAAERVAAYGVATQGGKDEAAVKSLPAVPVYDIALAALAAKCASFGLDALIMRATIAGNKRRGSYVAYLVDDIGAFVWERPKFSAWSAYDRKSRRDKHGAAVDLVNTCTAFPARGMLVQLCADLPAFVTTAAEEIRGLRNDIRSDVKTVPVSSEKPAAIPSSPPQC